VRAVFIETYLRQMEGSAAGRDALDALAAVRAEVAKRYAHAFLDGALMDEMLAVLARVGGEDAVFDTSRRHLITIAGGATLAPMIGGVGRAFGFTPLRMLRLAPRGRAAFVDKPGTLIVHEHGESAARLVLTGFHCRSLRLSCVQLAGMWLGIVQLCRTDGPSTVHELNDASGSAMFEVRWSVP
jgi:hypothetical protein